MAGVRQNELLETLRTGHAFAWEGNWQAAAETYRRALALDPGNVPAKVFLAMALANLRDLPQAITVLRDAAGLEQQPLVLAKLGELLADAGLSAEAAERYLAAGDLYWHRGSSAEAVSAWQAAALHSPHSTAPHARLAEAFATLGNESAAAAERDLLEQLMPVVAAPPPAATEPERSLAAPAPAPEAPPAPIESPGAPVLETPEPAPAFEAEAPAEPPLALAETLPPAAAAEGAPALAAAPEAEPPAAVTEGEPYAEESGEATLPEEPEVAIQAALEETTTATAAPAQEPAGSVFWPATDMEEPPVPDILLDEAAEVEPAVLLPSGVEEQAEAPAADIADEAVAALKLIEAQPEPAPSEAGTPVAEPEMAPPVSVVTPAPAAELAKEQREPERTASVPAVSAEKAEEPVAAAEPAVVASPPTEEKELAPEVAPETAPWRDAAPAPGASAPETQELAAVSKVEPAAEATAAGVTETELAEAEQAVVTQPVEIIPAVEPAPEPPRSWWRFGFRSRPQPRQPEAVPPAAYVPQTVAAPSSQDVPGPGPVAQAPGALSEPAVAPEPLAVTGAPGTASPAGAAPGTTAPEPTAEAPELEAAATMAGVAQAAGEPAPEEAVETPAIAVTEAQLPGGLVAEGESLAEGAAVAASPEVPYVELPVVPSVLAEGGEGGLAETEPAAQRVARWEEAVARLRRGEVEAALSTLDEGQGEWAALARDLPSIDRAVGEALSALPADERRDVEPGILRALLLAEAGLARAAEQEYEALIVSLPSCLVPQVGLARLFARAGRTEQARQKFTLVAAVYELRGQNDLAEQMRALAGAA